MKPVMFKNRMNGEKVICDNTRNVEVIDGVEYIFVRKLGQDRSHLMRKEALERIKEKIKQ
jgi:hypothetical protein